jgi:hypothetical protein
LKADVQHPAIVPENLHPSVYPRYIVQEKKEERNTFMGLPGQGGNPG